MRLFLVRHAKAEDKEKFRQTGRDDSLRPLTSKGELEFAEVAKHFRSLCPDLDALWTSPLRRAEQTAEFILLQYPELDLTYHDELVPDYPLPNFIWALNKSKMNRVAAVGHEPHLSSLLSYLLFARDVVRPWLEFKKGSIAALEFEGAIRPGQGRLLWFMTPPQLRLLSV